MTLAHDKRERLAELSDERIEELHEEGAEAALHAWGPGGCSARNPYPEDSAEADIWGFAFRQAYARENR